MSWSLTRKHTTKLRSTDQREEIFKNSNAALIRLQKLTHQTGMKIIVE